MKKFIISAITIACIFAMVFSFQIDVNNENLAQLTLEDLEMSSAHANPEDDDGNGTKKCRYLGDSPPFFKRACWDCRVRFMNGGGTKGTCTK